MIRRLLVAIAPVAMFLAVASACTSTGAPEPQADPTLDGAIMPDNRLASSLHAESFADSVRFSLRVTNAEREPVELTFPTGQSFDFIVSQDGREVWRWSGEMMFTQAIRQETLAPEETRSYTATWSPPAGVRGEFTVRGFLTAQEHRTEQQAEFRLP